MREPSFDEEKLLAALASAQRAGSIPVPAPKGRVWVLEEEERPACLPWAAALPNQMTASWYQSVGEGRVANTDLTPVLVKRQVGDEVLHALHACSPIFISHRVGGEALEELISLADAHGHFAAPAAKDRVWCVLAPLARGFEGNLVTVSEERIDELPGLVADLRPKLVATGGPGVRPVLVGRQTAERRTAAVFSVATI